MRQDTLIQKLTMLVLFLGVAAYLAGAAWRSMQEPYPTVPCHTYTVDDSAEATGLLIRREQLLAGQGGIVDVVPDEGEKVGAGQTVAVVYRDEVALARRRELKALDLEAEQLNYAILRGDSGWDSARLDESIVAAMVDIRAAAAAGDLTTLEDQSLSFKSLVLSREATYAGGAAGAAQRIQAVDGEIQAMTALASQDTTAVRAPVAGVFSAAADGLEAVLTPEILATLTPMVLDELSARVAQPPEGAVGRLITSSEWHFSTNLPEVVADRLDEGKKVTVRFSRDWSGDAVMKVERISAPQDGRCAVTFASSLNLADTTMLRAQTVDIIFSSKTGIRVPKKALRSEMWTEKDPETGEVIREYQVNGVYVLTGAQAEFRPVDILADDGDYYLVETPATETKRVLHSGDGVIVAAEPLFDGKVVR